MAAQVQSEQQFPITHPKRVTEEADAPRQSLESRQRMPAAAAGQVVHHLVQVVRARLLAVSEARVAAALAALQVAELLRLEVLRPQIRVQVVVRAVTATIQIALLQVVPVGQDLSLCVMRFPRRQHPILQLHQIAELHQPTTSQQHAP